MKKIVLMFIAMLSVTMTFAENENVTNVEKTDAYDMSVNIRKLCETLGLTIDQMETVADIHNAFCGEMMVASQAGRDERSLLVKNAVVKDLKYMRYILSDKQYRKYQLLLNMTLTNRGLNDFAE
jgi:hypothetical protein